MQIVSGGDAAFGAMAFGMPSANTINFLAREASTLSNVSCFVGEAIKGFRQQAENLYTQFMGSEAMRVARNAIRHVAGIFDEDTIYGFTTLEDTQTAKPVMQRFIMAMPQLREMYHEQRVDGYSSSYVDLQPGVVGEDHYDYRRVTDGIMMDSDDSDDLVWVTHYEDLADNDRALDISEQADILNTWDLVSGLIAQRHDPTDVYGGRL